MKTAVVSGAGLRIGKDISIELLKNGYHVILCAHSSFKELQGWVKNSPYAEQIIDLVNADLSEQKGQDELCLRVKNKLTSLDLLVNNASIFYPKAFLDISRKEYEEMQAINLTAPFFITQSLLEVLKVNNGCVINILDALWDTPSINFSHYAVTKAGLAILTKSLAKELAPSIRVNAISPGAIMFQDFHTLEYREKTLAQIPQKRLGTGSEIAEAVLFLAQKGQYITGQLLAVDGGRSI